MFQGAVFGSNIEPGPGMPEGVRPFKGLLRQLSVTHGNPIPNLLKQLQNHGRDKRAPPVSSQERKNSAFLGRDGLVPSATAKVLQLPLL